MQVDTAYNIPSEACEPFCAMILGRMWARTEEAKAKHGARSWEHQDAWMSCWFALDSLSKLAISIKTATHFSIAVGNEQSRLASLIRHELGIDPMNEPGWGWEVSSRYTPRSAA